MVRVVYFADPARTLLTKSWRPAEVASDSFAYIQEEPTAEAVVLVHGYGGSPATTWRDFDVLAREDVGRDWYFVGYESVSDRVTTSAYKLRVFLSKLAPNPEEVFLVSYYGRAPDRTYNRVTLVGHSLGGVVIRDAIRQLHQHDPQASALGSITRIVLFSPALYGAKPARWLGAFEGFSGDLPLLQRFKGLVTGYSPSYREITDPQPHGVLAVLRAERPPRGPHSEIVWADPDDVVDTGPTRTDDKVVALVPGRGHTEVCKPASPAYLTPWALVTTGAVIQSEVVGP